MGKCPDKCLDCCFPEEEFYNFNVPGTGKTIHDVQEVRRVNLFSIKLTPEEKKANTEKIEAQYAHLKTPPEKIVGRGNRHGSSKFTKPHAINGGKKVFINGEWIAAKNIDVDNTLPEIGDWEETHIVWDFGDGWRICEDRTAYDRRLNAKLTMTCVTSLISRCFPNSEPYKSLSYWIKVSRQNNGGRYYQDYFRGKEDEFEGFIKRNAESLYNNHKKFEQKEKRVYKLLHLRDPEERPRCCILAMLASIGNNPDESYKHSYGSKRDLGQEHPVVISRSKMHILEVRLGTGHAAPKIAEERVIQWYRESTGKWDEDKYQEALYKRSTYSAVKHDRDLTEWKKAA